jgi:hypothetical protein
MNECARRAGFGRTHQHHHHLPLVCAFVVCAVTVEKEDVFATSSAMDGSTTMAMDEKGGLEEAIGNI